MPAAPAKKKTPDSDPRAALVDEWGELRAKIAPMEARVKEIKADLALEFTVKPKENAYHVWGTSYELVVSACKSKRTITDVLKLYKILGLRKFLENCSFPLAAVDEHLDLQQRAAVLTEAPHGGSREMTLKAIEPKEAAA